MQARLRSFVALTMLALGLSLVLVPSSAQAAPGKPKVGQCHDLSAKRAYKQASDSSRPVPCSAKHTLQTVGVPRSRTSFAGMPLAEVLRIGSSLCNASANRALRGNATKQHLTAWESYFFVPSASQRAAGARWVRCDIGLLPHDTFRPLPKQRLRLPVLKGKLSDYERVCLAKPGRWTTCDQPHRYRAIRAFLSASTAYPTPAQVQDEAYRRCPATTDFLTWTSETRWAAGGRYVTCYDKTRR